MEFVRAEAAGDGNRPPPPAPGMHGLRFRVLGWNIGGAALEQLPDAVSSSTGSPLKESILLLQECPRVAPGWKTTKLPGMTVLGHRQSDQWRGCGLAYGPSSWAPISKKCVGDGIWVVMKHLCSGERVLFGSFHLVPGMNQADYAAAAEKFLQGMPKGHRRVVVQGDLNAPFAWVQADTGDIASGLDGKALLVLDLLAGVSLQPLAPRREDQGWPTSRPRQEGRAGAKIDLMASRGVRHLRGRVHRDSCLTLNADHELQEGCFEIRVSSSLDRLRDRGSGRVAWERFSIFPWSDSVCLPVNIHSRFLLEPTATARGSRKPSGWPRPRSLGSSGKRP